MDEIRESWVQALRAENRSPETLRCYSYAVSSLLEFTRRRHPSNRRSEGLPTRHIIRAYLDHQLRTNSPATAAIRHRALTAFFKWCLTEGEIEVNPMIGVKAPRVPMKPTPVLTDAELERLLDIPGLSFTACRDRAILRFFVDTGCRLSEVAGLRVGDVCLEARTAQVMGKGAKPRAVGLSSQVVASLSAYGWTREVHRHAHLSGLWLGPYGVLLAKAIYKIVKRHGEAVGVDVHPHSLRHVFADRWLRAGGGELDLQTLCGWSSPQMLQRYGASQRTERALEAHRRLYA